MEGINTFSKAIKAKCLDCCCGQMSEVRNCPVKTCALYNFRDGHNHFSKRTMSDEQKMAAKIRMQNYWANKNS